VHEIQGNAALLRSAPAFAGAPVIRHEGGLHGADDNLAPAAMLAAANDNQRGAWPGTAIPFG
jgi:hypothetical protein